MTRAFLVRGMLVGILAGLLTFGFLKLYGEPQVDRAIAFETQRDEAKAAAEKAKGMQVEEEPELVSRPVQAGLGLFAAVMVYSTAFGGLFGLAFAFAYGRVDGTLTPQGVSLLLAATGFIAIYLVPNLKYPANPPSVGLFQICQKPKALLAPRQQCLFGLRGLSLAPLRKWQRAAALAQDSSAQR